MAAMNKIHSTATSTEIGVKARRTHLGGLRDDGDAGGVGLALGTGSVGAAFRICHSMLGKGDISTVKSPDRTGQNRGRRVQSQTSAVLSVADTDGGSDTVAAGDMLSLHIHLTTACAVYVVS